MVEEKTFGKLATQLNYEKNGFKSILKKLKDLVKKDAWLTDLEDMCFYITEWRDTLHGNPMIVLFPESTLEVSSIVKFCAKNKIEMVPQGGNTGLCGGAIPDDTGSQVIISLERLNKIRGISIEDQVIEVEAGCLLSNVQDQVTRKDFIFPILRFPKFPRIHNVNPFLQKTIGEADRIGDTQIPNYSSTSQYVYESFFDLVGRCLCFHTSGFPQICFQFSDFPNLQESTISNSLFEEYPVISESLWDHQILQNTKNMFHMFDVR